MIFDAKKIQKNHDDRSIPPSDYDLVIDHIHTRLKILGLEGQSLCVTSDNPIWVNKFKDLGWSITCPERCDIWVNMWSLHYKEDPQAYLGNLLLPVHNKALCLVCFPGGDTLKELRHYMFQADERVYGGIHPRVHPMIDGLSLTRLLQSLLLEEIVVDVISSSLKYQNLENLLMDLRRWGETNALKDRRKTLDCSLFLKVLKDQIPHDEPFSMTLDILLGTFFKKDIFKKHI